ncbi:MAG: hypothetical protein O6922_06285, partial [Chloroflexi bacterium]|nr:hypothetical protein [Chloroflexota bacterium]
MNRIEKRRGAFRPILSLGLVLFAIFLTGCEVLATEGAREAIAGQREVRALEDQELGPLEQEMHDLFVNEIQPREAEIEDLRHVLRILEEDVLRPLWEKQDDVWAPGGEASELQLAFKGRYKELELLQRAIEIEQRELDSKWQGLWATGATVDPEFKALEDLRYDKQRELDRAYRFGNRPIEDIWNEINELNNTQNWGNTDSQIRAEELNAELRLLYDRYNEVQHNGSGEARLLEEKARLAQDELSNLYDHGWDQIYRIYNEIDRLDRERADHQSSAVNDEAIWAYIAELERLKASYVESRDAELASLQAALAAAEEEAATGATTTVPSGDNSTRIAELEQLIADLEAQSASLLASKLAEIDSLNADINVKNDSYNQLIDGARADFLVLSASLLDQAAAVGVELDALIAIGGDDVAPQIAILQQQKDLLIASEGSEETALNELVAQYESERDAGVVELKASVAALEAAIAAGLTDANDAQIVVYAAELEDLRNSPSGGETIVLVSNTTTSADIQANIQATRDYWNGLIDETVVEILELQSQLGAVTVDDSSDARIHNLRLQAAELEQALNDKIANLEAFVNELYRQANDANSGESAGMVELQSQIDALNERLESIWRNESSQGIDLLKRVQVLEEQARVLEAEFQQKTRVLEEELWEIDDRLSVYYRDQESGGRLIQVEFEAEMALLHQRRTVVEEQWWAIELEERSAYDEIEAKNAVAFAEIKKIEDGQFRDVKSQIRLLETELRGFYKQQREIELRMDEARQLVEDRQRQLEDDVLDLLEEASGAIGTLDGLAPERPADATF